MAAQDVGCPTQRDLGVHIVRGMAPWRIIAQYLGPQRRADARTRRQRPPRRRRARHADDGLAPPRDAAGGGRLRARLPRAQRAARRARLAGRRRIGARRRARGDEPGRRAPPPDRVRARQQRLRLLHAGAPRVRRRRTWPSARPRTASPVRSSTAPTSSPSTAPRRRRSSARAAAAGRRCSSSSRCAWRGTRCTTTRSTCRPSCSPRGASATRSRCCEARLLALGGGFDEAADEALRSEVAREVDVAVELALASEWPDPATLTDGVYR